MPAHTRKNAFRIGRVILATVALLGGAAFAEDAPSTSPASQQSVTAAPAANGQAGELMRSGAGAFSRGEFGAAERDWTQADALYATSGDTAGRLDAWLNLGAVQQQTGKFALAIGTLQKASSLATKSGQTDKLAGIQNALGVAYTFTRRPDDAESTLKAALSLAEEHQDLSQQASIHNNLGNLYAAWGEVLKDKGEGDKSAETSAQYMASADLAAKGGDTALAAKALTNAALSAAREGQAVQATDLNAKALQAVQGLPDSLDKANLLIAIGQTDETLLKAPSAPADASTLQRQAFNAYEQARVLAKTLGNPLVGSYAVGYQGRLYELAKRSEDSLTLTRRAVQLAQQAQSPDSLYIWQWQSGRAFRAMGKTEEAITAYTAARETLEAVRSDLALGYGNRGMKATFRSEVGPLYYELADLLLTRADTVVGDEARVQQYLSDARNTVERLRVGELESYFEDPCVNQAQSQRTDLTRDLGRIPRGNPAVVYLIPLADRVEILVTTRQGMKRIKSTEVGAEQLTQEVREFRKRLEKRTTHRYLTQAKQLYTWLIKPIEPLLQSEGIDTLVFVPDGALRTVPMAALHDGKDFLISKYAVAISPGLSLSLSDSNPAEVRKSARRVLATGISDSREGFAALPSVKQELAEIGKVYGDKTTTLLNGEFLNPAFRKEFTRPGDEEFSIVHIASHGVFAPNIADTYILTYDDKLKLSDLESVLRPYQLQGKPIDLLTLSACQTSAGDDQAARERASLGLGGLAVKAGARSALASLWLVNDDATAKLITTFYEELAAHPEAGKAKALQKAQQALIADESTNHPQYWAPFLLIGDWL